MSLPETNTYRVKSVDRELEIIDGTHEIPQYDIWSASYRLYQAMQFWPAGTIFVSVVDPGVGTSRKACIASTAGGYFVVTPDNGTLTHIKNWVGITDVREIDETINRLRGKNTKLSQAQAEQAFLALMAIGNGATSRASSGWLRVGVGHLEGTGGTARGKYFYGK